MKSQWIWGPSQWVNTATCWEGGWEHRSFPTSPLPSYLVPCLSFTWLSQRSCILYMQLVTVSKALSWVLWVVLANYEPQGGDGLVKLSCWIVSNSLRPHGLQNARPPCPSLTPRVYSNPCPLNQWCHPTISSSVIPFSSHLQFFPASRSFQMSQFFPLGSQSIGVSASASVLPMNIQDWFPLGWTGWISLQPEGLSRVFSNTTVQKHQFFGTQLSL